MVGNEPNRFATEEGRNNLFANTDESSYASQEETVKAKGNFATQLSVKTCSLTRWIVPNAVMLRTPVAAQSDSPYRTMHHKAENPSRQPIFLPCS